MQIPSGTYQGTATDGSYYKSNGGALMVAICFNLENEGVEGKTITSHQCIIRKDGSLSDIGKETLEQCFNWTSGNPADLVEIFKAGESRVDLVIEDEQFIGSDGTPQTASKVKWINPIGGSGGGLPQCADIDQIMAEFGATLRAGFGGKAQKKPTSAPKPAPTAIAPPPRKLPVTEPQFTAAMAWDACRKNVPTGAQEKWSETLDSIFGSKPEADFTSADWKRVADHFEVGGDDVPF